MLILTLSLLTIILVLLPLLGVHLYGLPIAQFLEFPPKTKYVVHEPFSWPMFGLIALFILAFILPLIWRLLTHKEKNDEIKLVPFPWWGWLGIFGGLFSWTCAWTRLSWMGTFQPHTFTPLWFSYILVFNGLTLRRSGRCPLSNFTLPYLALFPISAMFWWFFEYLNRFVQTWYYVGAGVLTPTQYIIRASLAFSTVLPAVLVTCAWLNTYPTFSSPLRKWVKMDMRYPRLLAAVVLLLASLGLAFVGVAPNHLHALLWISPLLIITSIQALAGKKTIFSALVEGNWQRIWTPAIAALICGFFWEMWNIYSLAKWQYSVPFVHRYLLFEMPILGYAGYLPFGLECVVVIELIFPSLRSSWMAGTKVVYSK